MSLNDDCGVPIRIFNRAVAKLHALKCSKLRRAGKFTRVGDDFLTEFEADVEAFVRSIRNMYPTRDTAIPLDPSVSRLVTGELMDKIQTEVNLMLARMIQNKVQRQPSCGCTLKNTR